MISTSIQRPGAYFSFTFTSRQGGFTPLAQRIALIGIQTASSVAENTVTRVLSSAEADSLFGVGSELALMARKCFDAGSLRGSLPEIWCVPLTAPAGVATENTITISGTPTATGDLVIRIAGRTMRVPVTPTSTGATIAADLKDEADAQNEVMPVTTAVLSNVLTTTHRSTGVNGNDVKITADSIPSGLSVVIAQSVAGTGATDITDALSATLGIDFNGIAIANHTSVDTADALTHVQAAHQPGEKKWVTVFFASTGSLGTVQTLASDDDYRLSVDGYRNSPSLPSELAAAKAALVFSTEIPNFNFDNAVLPIYHPPTEDVWTGAEIEALLAAGVSPVVPGRRSGESLVVKAVTTQVTKDGVPFFPVRDITVPLTGYFIARQLDAQYSIIRPNDIAGLRDMVVDVDRRAEALGYIRNVSDLIPAIAVEEDELVPGRANVVNPIEPVVPLHQAVFEIVAAV